MSLVTVVLRKFVLILQSIAAGIGRLLSFGRKKNNIGELPFTVAQSERLDARIPAVQSQQNQSWDDGWQSTATSFQEEAVSSKIEEYRRKKAEEMQRREQSAHSGEVDFFGEMQPTIKAGKTVLFKSNLPHNEPKQSRNLFAFNEDSLAVPQTATAELGELNFDQQDTDQAAWDIEIDLDEVQATEDDQKRRDRDEKHRQRREQHERRMKEKRNAMITS